MREPPNRATTAKLARSLLFLASRHNALQSPETDRERFNVDRSVRITYPPGTMLEHVIAFSKGGIVLWSYSFDKLRGNPINNLIRSVLLEVRNLRLAYVAFSIHIHFFKIDRPSWS
jgi:signal recognition particle receptor subunit alpha